MAASARFPTTMKANLLAFVLFAWVALMPTGRADAQWTEVNGLYGGPCTIFVDSTSLFATNGYGLFRTTDTGVTWAHVLNNGDYGVRSFAGFGSIRFIEVSFDATNYRSTDGGVTWIPIPEESYLDNFFYYGGKVFAGKDGGTGLWVSIDSGLHWNLTKNALDTLTVYDIESKGSDLFAATNESVWRSTDGGTTWFDPWRSGGGGEWVTDTDTIVVIKGRYRYEYDSTFVSFVNQTGPIASVGATLFEVAAYDGHVVGSTDYFGATGVFASTDTGATWTQSDKGISGNYINWFYSTGSKLLAATESGIFCSSDTGFSWTQVGNLPEGGAYSFAIVGSSLYAAGDSGIFRSSDYGKMWTPPYRAGVFPVNSIASVGDTMYASANSDYPVYCKGTFRSTDYGATWNQLNEAPITLLGSPFSILFGVKVYPNDSLYSSTNRGTNWKATLPAVSPYYINDLCSLGPNLFGSTRRNILESTDSGNTWNPAGDVSDSMIYSFASAESDVVVGCYERIFRSSDQGKSWIPTTNGLPDSAGAIYSPVVAQDSEVVVGFWTHEGGHGLLLSSDDGLNWKFVECQAWPYGDEPMTIVLFASDIFVGLYEGGVEVSTNQGATWSMCDSGFRFGSSEPIFQLFSIKDDLYASSSDGSIYRLPLSEMIPPSAVSQPPQATQAIHSYPNPFTQSAKISFSLREAGYADVSIVNALGAEVARLFSGELGAGNHSFAWDALGEAPGNYWCIVRTRDGVRRIGLLRE